MRTIVVEIPAEERGHEERDERDGPLKARQFGFDAQVRLICRVAVHREVRALHIHQRVELVRPGGVIVLGVYNAIARIPTRLRRAVARVSGFRLVPFDPILRDRSHDPERREAWLRDQYRHPEEHRHTIGEVQRWFAEHGVEYLRTYPSAVFDDTPEDLFTRAADNWGLESWLTQIAWMRTLGREGGLFLTIGRKEGESTPL